MGGGGGGGGGGGLSPPCFQSGWGGAEAPPAPPLFLCPCFLLGVRISTVRHRRAYSLMQRMGACDVDLNVFSVRHNAQLKRFYSYPAAEATDALSQTWKQSILYAFPPFNLY